MMLTGCGLKYPPPPLPAATHLAGSPDEILASVRRVLGA
jgi:hypothetical protein